MTTASATLRDITGMGQTPTGLKDATLVMVDCQNTYREGIMQLTNVEPAILEAKKLLQMARDLGRPVIHIRHDAGIGSPYDVTASIGQISDEVAPIKGESVITKNYPNSFWNTDLEAQLRELGAQNLVIAGFMTHVCIDSTSRGAFNLGFNPTVVANACATRALALHNGKVIEAQTMHESALAALRDLFAVVVEDSRALA